tara:strand:- start:1071 stop:1382 length:312 start_codon:yes stop_codon:yes gene_type:complete
MLLKKIIFPAVLLLSSLLIFPQEKTSKPAEIKTIQFKDLTEFDACFLIYRSPISFNLKDMLRDYMKFREFTCTKYDEILKRATIVKGSFPKKSKAYELNKKKK